MGPVLLHLGRDRVVLHRVPAQPGPDAARGRRADSSRASPSLAQNSDPFTYFGGRPVRVCARRRDRQRHARRSPSCAARRSATWASSSAALLSEPSASPPPDHRQIDHFARVTEGRIESLSLDEAGKLRRFPVQVDGDYIGDHGELDLGVDPGALTVVAYREQRLPLLLDRRRRGSRPRSSSRTTSRSRSSTSARSSTATRCWSRASTTRRSGTCPTSSSSPLRQRADALGRGPRRDGRPGHVRRDEQHRLASASPTSTSTSSRVKKDGLRGFFWPRDKYKSDEQRADVAAERAGGDRAGRQPERWRAAARDRLRAVRRAEVRRRTDRPRRALGRRRRRGSAVERLRRRRGGDRSSRLPTAG